MKENTDIEALWEILSSIERRDERLTIIDKDRKRKRPKYKKLAENDPFRLFQLLGGDESKIVCTNWAFKYTYEDYLSESGEEYDPAEADTWNLEEMSIQNAHDTGHWYVTGSCVIKGTNGIELPFEFEYSEGYLDSIIGTPYDAEKHGNHGIPFQ